MSPNQQAKTKSNPFAKSPRLVAAIVFLVVVVGGLLLYGSRNWVWSESQLDLPEEFADGFGQVLRTVYENPSGTFKVRFPTQPNVIDVGFMGFPVINYYAVDTKTGDEFKVSHIKDTVSIMGVDAEKMLENASQVLLGEIANGGKTPGQGQFKLLSNEVLPGGGREVTAEITDPVNNEYSLYRLLGKGSAMMVISAGNNQKRAKTYQKFLDSFVWQTMENDDQSSMELNLSPENMIDGEEMVETGEMEEEMEVEPVVE